MGEEVRGLRSTNRSLQNSHGDEKYIIALAGVAQWIECWHANPEVDSSIPSQGTCLGCGPGP